MPWSRDAVVVVVAMTTTTTTTTTAATATTPTLAGRLWARMCARLRVRAGACAREAAHMSVYACVGAHAWALAGVYVCSCVRVRARACLRARI